MDKVATSTEKITVVRIKHLPAQLPPPSSLSSPLFSSRDYPQTYCTAFASPPYTGSPLRRLPLDLIVLARVQHDLVRMARCHARVTLGPVVRDRVGEDGAGAVEARGGDGAGGRVEGYSRYSAIST